MLSFPTRWLLLLPLLVTTVSASAEISVCSLFTDHMVVQRDKPVRVWGWTDAGAEVTASLGGHDAKATAGSDGRFEMELAALPAGGPHELVIQSGNDAKTISDVLVGEVWICSGQSNMAWAVQSANDADLESLSANYPQIRLISVPQVGTQEPQKDFNGQWSVCSPSTVKDFSAVGYFFGRQLHQTLDVPIGLIDNAWGGSAAEAWISRQRLEKAGEYEDLLNHWDEMARNYDFAKMKKAYEERRQAWIDGGRKGNAPRAPRDAMSGNHRPANIYNGVLKPTIGYSIRGAIWYQGESNSSRAYQYRNLFPLMIQSWRDEWGQGDFPFYWVQLADFRAEVDQPAESDWAELREAQTMTMDKLSNTGQAVIIDLGEASDIHPKNKQDVAKRLARWALAKDYGIDVPYQSPRFDSVEFDGDKAIVKFSHTGRGLDTFDVREMIGFTIAGDDKNFVHAEAKLMPGTKDTVVVSSPEVSDPVAVRYAWADNPICNVQSADGLPLTPFRSDDFPGVTAGRTAP
ncbi:sialate O-acetylesterase [Crateriforma spongiae]|uniref:sialate O-acetylesterase n=1 Tax=Crateriforma spongiae TaxID=2724528 RepID=UPI0039AFF7A1